MHRRAAAASAAFVVVVVVVVVAGVMMRILKRLLDPRELQENRYLPGNLFVCLCFLEQNTFKAVSA